MFSQAPPVWLGADRKLSPTHNPWTSTALLSSAPCLGFPAVPPAAGSYGAEQPRSLQTQPPAMGKIDAGCASSSDQKTSMRIWVSDRYSQPALLHLKVEEKKKKRERGRNPAMVNVGQYSSAQVSIWKQSSLIAAGCRGQEELTEHTDYAQVDRPLHTSAICT